MSVAAIEALAAYTAENLASGTSVYVGELPRRSGESTPKTPSKAVVLRPNGGPPYDVSLQIVRERVELVCYGPTGREADELRREVYDLWRPLSHLKQGDAVLHWMNPVGGARYERDPDTEWPVLVQPWVLQSAEQAAA
jgi:hypothetical protein